MKSFNFKSTAAFVIPIAIFLIARAFAYYISIAGNCWAGFSSDCWVRWDSALYLDIAQHGHNLFHCGPDQGYPIGATDWCGNAGWAPLYPFFITLIHNTFGIALPMAGIWISAVFFFGFLLVSAQILEVNNFSIKNWILILIIAFSPGNIYFHAVFPMSQTVFFLSLLILFLKKNRLLLAGIAGMLAIMSYSIGFILLAVLGIHSIFLFINQKRIPYQYILKTLLPATVGLVFIFVYDHFSTGHWNAMFLIQGKYGHTLNSPIKMLGQHFDRLISNKLSVKTFIEIQTLYMVIHAISLSILTWKTSGKEFKSLNIAFMLLFWFIPFSASLDVALYRNAAVFSPSNTELKHLPLWALLLILTVFVTFSYFLGILFIQSVLV